MKANLQTRYCVQGQGQGQGGQGMDGFYNLGMGQKSSWGQLGYGFGTQSVSVDKLGPK